MPKPSPNCYRYQDIYCVPCREVSLHKQIPKFGRARRIAMWTNVSYRCTSCSKIRKAKPYMDADPGAIYACTRPRMSRGKL